VLPPLWEGASSERPAPVSRRVKRVAVLNHRSTFHHQRIKPFALIVHRSTLRVVPFHNGAWISIQWCAEGVSPCASAETLPTSH